MTSGPTDKTDILLYLLRSDTTSLAWAKERMIEAADEIARLRTINADHLIVLVAILEAVRDNDMFRVGQYVTAAIAKARGEQA
jgi:hypothetical protein